MEMPKVTRRTFLKVSATTGAAAAAAPRLLNAMENELGGKDFGPVTGAERKAIPINCHVCNIQDGAIAYVENDRVVKLEGNPEHVSTRGRLCAKGNAGMWYSYDPDRILYPLKRVGARGEGKWKRISWDEALTELAAKLDAAIKEDPNTIMLKYGRNRSGGVIDRFMKTLGSATVVNHTSVCESSKKIGMEPTWGPDIETPDFANAKYVLNFGSNILEAAYFHNPLSQRVTEGRVDNHSKIVTFDVRLSNTAGFSDEWVPVHPGTDGAVALAMGHVILRDDLQDSEFIETWTNVTVKELRENYKTYTPEWASKISGVPAETIERIATEFATTKPATLFTYRGPAKHLYGSYNERSCMMLPIMTGNIEKKGGYCLPRGMGWPQPSPEPGKPKKDSYLSHPTEYPLAGHKVSHLVPFWIADGKQKINVYITYQDNPVYTNPGAMAVWGKLFKDEKLIPYLVSMSPFMGEETALVDLILPDCPYLERWEPESMPNSLWPWLGIRQPVHKSLGESRENRIMMRDIIWKLDPDGKRGMKQFWNFKDGEDYMRQHFDNVPGLKEAGGLNFLKKHGVWPIYGKLDPENRQGRRQDGPRDQGGIRPVQEGVVGRRHGRCRSARTVSSAKNGKAIGVKRNGKNYVGFPTGNRIINVRVDKWAEYGFNPMPTFKRIPWHETMKEDELVMVHLQAQCDEAVAHGCGEVAGRDRPQQPDVDQPGHRRQDRRQDRRPGACRIKSRATRHQGLRHRRHPSEGGSIPTGFGHWEYGRLATLKLKDKKSEASGQDDPDLQQRLVGRQGCAPEQHHPGGGRSDRWFAGLVRHRGQGDQGRAERQVR
jgi:thiosulfate reductase/polysulfide reductase chain A